MKKLLILLFSVIFATSVNSQNIDIDYMSMAFRVGAGVSNLKGLDRYQSLADTYSYEGRLSGGNRFAWDVGIAFQTGLKNNFFFQTEGLIGILGSSVDGLYYKSGSEKTKVNSLDLSGMQLNMYLGKKVALSDNTRLFVAVGAYVNWDLSTSLFYDNDKESIISGYDADLKELDLGFIVSGGVEYGKFQFSFNPSFGVLDMTKDRSRVYHRAYKFAITYHFFCTD